MTLYVRTEVAKSSTPHALQTEYGHLGLFDDMKNDPGFVEAALAGINDSGRYILKTVDSTIMQYKETFENPDFRDLRPEVASQRREEMILHDRTTCYSYYKKAIEQAEEKVTYAENQILQVTEPQKSNGNAASPQDIRFMTIWNYLAVQDPKVKTGMIRGNEEFLKACVVSPIPIISKDVLLKLRHEFAFENHKDLFDQLNDAKYLLDRTRTRAAQINGAIVKMLISHDVPVPETDPSIHFSVFKPVGQFEELRAQKRINEYKRKQNQLARERERLEKLELSKQLETSSTDTNDLSAIERKGPRKDESANRRPELDKELQRLQKRKKEASRKRV